MVLSHPEDEFLFLFDRPFDPRYVYAGNVKAIALPPQARHPLLFKAWFEWSVPRALRKFGAEVFFSPDSMCSLRSSVPTVMTAHDIVPLHFPAQIAQVHRRFLLTELPRFLRRAEQVLTVSAYVKQDIMDTCGIPSDKIMVVYNGCREGFQPLQEMDKQQVRAHFAAGNPYFFYSGAIHPRKNIHRLIQAFDQFKQQSGAPAKLLLAGRFAWKTGEVKTAWEQAIHREDIQFLGYVPESDLTRLMAAAEALIYVSLSEGFGLPMIEAMQSGTPVMAADATCLPEVAGGAALLVDPYSIESMATGIKKLWEDKKTREELIERGKKRAQQFSWNTAADAVYAVLEKVGKKKQI